jgi:diguanylate cyclase (GGDEF)-like protein
MITFIVLQDRIKSQYNLLHQETTKIAKGYSNNLSNAANAKEIISELLDEKLYIASESIATKLNNLESSQLDALADEYRVDDIHIYNPQGVIEKNEESGFIAQNKNDEYYQFYQPINFDGVKIGTLAIYYDTESIRQSSRLIIMNGLVIYLIVLCILGYIVSSFYSKSKRYFDIGFYDKLSNLPNKHYFEEYIKPFLAKSDVQNQALIFINIKNFSAVNISYGYAFGDEVIKKIALNLKNINTVKTTLFRMESDRFLLFVENYTDENEILSLIAQINNVFSTSLDLSNSDYSLTVELGIVKLDEEDLELDRIMKNGAIALKNVKRDTLVNEGTEKVPSIWSII